ncbi:hypothetical protein, partial [Escherichia coli]|uniref:hypothetical protein n=1 Tax=Escherichia coli TaxID=562 RepID=UPI00195365FA
NEDASGRVGIGRTATSDALEVAGNITGRFHNAINSSYVSVGGFGQTNFHFGGGDTNICGLFGVSWLNFYTANTLALQIDASQLIG